MQVLLLLLSVLAAVTSMKISPETFSKVMKIHNDCRAKTGVAVDVAIRAAVMGEFPDDPTLRNYLLCFSKKMGFQNDDGILQLDTINENLRTFLPDLDNHETIMETCVVQKDSPEDTAIDAIKCFHKLLTS